MDMTIEAKKRDNNVKASTLRKEGWIPACLYGKGVETVQIQIPLKTVKTCLQKHALKFNVKVAGMGTYSVGMSELQKDAFGTELIHISLHILNNNEMTHLTVPLTIVGKAKGSAGGGILKEAMHEVTIKGFPKDLVDEIKVDVTNLDLGENIHLRDLVGGYKFTFNENDLDKIVVTCNYPKLKAIETPETVVAIEEVATVEGANTEVAAHGKGAPAATTTAPAAAAANTAGKTEKKTDKKERKAA